MRRLRWSVLALIAVLIGGVGFVYRAARDRQAREAPGAPRVLAESESARADYWTWENTRDGKPTVRVRARSFSQNAEATRIDLEDVELHIFSKDGLTYNKVTSHKATFEQKDDNLYSDGDVEITTGLPAEPGNPPGQRVVIRTSGVRFHSKSGQASTERFAAFEFENGEGQSTGALYDPALRELQMHSNVKLRWRGQDPKAPPMDIEAASLLYKESTSEILMSTWSKFRRDTLSMDGGQALVRLSTRGTIESVDALKATGVDQRPDRRIEYGANTLYIKFDEKGVLKSVTGDGAARLQSSTATSNTRVDSGRLDLDFVAVGSDALLRKALAMNGAVVESKPVPRAGVPMADTRVLKSEVVNLYMRDGGKEMDRVETDSAGHIDFLPNRPDSKRRSIDGTSLNFRYGKDNQLKTFTANQAVTRTENGVVKGKPQPPTITSSRGLAAHFDEKTGAMSLLEQFENFQYEEGDRRAKSDRADFHAQAGEIVLTGKARVWDPTGSTDADKITLREKSGEFEAAGSVTSTRQPEKKKDAKTGMMSVEEPVQARAKRMTSYQDNTLVVYEGDALLWQGSNRITAELIRIDRRSGYLEASGGVVTQLLDKKESKKGSAVFTVVRAPSLEYDDRSRLAHYRGGVNLKRAGMTVDSRELRAWLTEDSGLERSFADGNVRIVQTAPARVRTGQSEHAEYYVDEGKIVLERGQPVFTDSVKGTTRGRKITYYSGDERFIVEGGASAPVESKIRRKSD